MSLYWIKTNALIKKIFSNYVWSIPNSENKIYLTFDDGPTPIITDWVLDELEKQDAKATFFCIGNNIEKHPEIFAKTINKGHAVGNHTFNHLNGWKVNTKKYVENTKICETAIYNLQSKIFRPPFGKIKISQSIKLRSLGYKIIMWDVLSADFDNTISPEKCLKNVLKNVESGSIIVFHDSKKAYKNLSYTLPKALKYWKEKGLVFDVIK
ncbi:MAG: polysaccharide deacetylase family protein [Flavobacterium sp.]|nr:polysaccharide deacetylase family protein [Flavobacterium sp.]